jgi:hypothetical protein
MIYLYTDRRGFRPFVHHPERLFYGAGGPPVGTAEEVLANLQRKRAQYLVTVPLPGFSEEVAFAEAVTTLRERYPERLATRYKGADGRFMVFEIVYPR